MMPSSQNRLVQCAALLLVLGVLGVVYWAGSNAGRQSSDATLPNGASAELNAENANRSTPVDPSDKAAQQRSKWLEEQASKMKERSKRSTGMLELAEDEQAYVNEALARKMDARQLLQSELLALLTRALDRQATDEELLEAIADVERVRQQVTERVKEIDVDLNQRVPLRARARMLASGMLDNGLGLMSGAAPRGEGPSMADGPAGGMGPGRRGGIGAGRP